MGKGTGLGLSIRFSHIIHKHEGEILVDSTVGRWHHFYGQAAAGVKKTLTQSKKREAKTQSVKVLKEKLMAKILIVDDDIFSRSLPK